MCPDGLDGLICNAGVSGASGNLPLIISLNYFGSVRLARGVEGLLEKKKGCCIITSSNTISQGAGRRDIADLLNNIGDEKMICEIVKKLDAKDVYVGNSIYVATKYALARWVRRVSSSWAARGVRVNAVAPGNIQTPMTKALQGSAREALNALPIPTMYGKESLMPPEQIAGVFAFLTSPEAMGVNGNVMFFDGGTDALLNSEKVY
ncbi:SDR family oxidoreductase [Aminicella lysinilytica]|uniref:Enoyl-ACP reductase-like protein n=1 Tax=Aminicella lysinilytica TaxID=433323 RepID=A0A4V3CSC1_9FIRM|nr:SDR family oxidoreductase [Aminicella lysinilytica]TDP59772.1 enoyl-ACP reductase-like protein [Aminicella lysinilytica]